MFSLNFIIKKKMFADPCPKVNLQIMAQIGHAARVHEFPMSVKSLSSFHPP